MKIFLNFLKAILVWSAYKATFSRWEWDGTEFNYTMWLVGRWYSPCFWIFYLTFLVLYVLFRGLTGLVEWFKDVKYDLTNKGQDENTSFNNSFKPEIGYIKRRLILFRLIYGS